MGGGGGGGVVSPGARTGGAWRTPSASVKSRPGATAPPSMAKKFGVTNAARIWSDVPSSFTSEMRNEKKPVIPENWRMFSCMSRRSPGASGKSRTFRLVRSAVISASWPGSLYGSGRSSTALTTLKIAVVAPMPRASVMSAVSVNAGLLRSVRTPKAKSFSQVSTRFSRIPNRTRIPNRRPQKGWPQSGHQTCRRTGRVSRGGISDWTTELQMRLSESGTSRPSSGLRRSRDARSPRRSAHLPSRASGGARSAARPDRCRTPASRTA